jgi:hypothetical protein
MGGAISLIVSLLAVVAFTLSDWIVMASVSALVAVMCLWSWLHMWYFARVLARQRTYVAALNRGEIREGAREAERYWHELQVIVQPEDVRDVPDWITKVNIIASLCAFVLAVWGGILYWRS